MADELSPEQKAAKDLADKAIKDAADAAAKAATESVMAGMKDAIGSQVQDALGQFVRDRQAPPKQDEPEVDPITKLITPTLKPALDRANLLSEAALDQSVFFQTHPDALEHREALVKNWNSMFGKGIPLKMETVWNEYRGNAENFPKFVKSQMDKDQAKLDAAKESEGVGPGSPDKDQAGARAALKDPYAASEVDLTKALENVAF